MAMFHCYVSSPEGMLGYVGICWGYFFWILGRDWTVHQTRVEYVGICWDMLGYPLVNIQKAMENGHRNSGFPH